MKVEITKGEWELIGIDDHYVICGENEDATANYLAKVEGNDVYTNLANAKLIAAAPELLEALKTMTTLTRLKYGNLDKDVYDEILKAEAAIKKATEL